MCTLHTARKKTFGGQDSQTLNMKIKPEEAAGAQLHLEETESANVQRSEESVFTTEQDRSFHLRLQGFMRPLTQFYIFILSPL